VADHAGRQLHADVEDFTEFEQRAAYLDFPPAPKLDVLGKLDPKKATPEELRGRALFFDKAQCAACHTPPYYTDNLMHNLRAERFYRQRTVNGMVMAADGPIKTFPLRGIKDSPPYMHDGRLLTLDDTVEFFNVILGTQLTAQEKQDLVSQGLRLAPRRGS
jgi:cytochrome c peroxidase